MIVFRKIRYKNLLGVGNSPIEIQLDRSKTTLIHGRNGAGKSTFIESLTFGLYGKPFRSVKKAQLVNSVNGKQCLVEVWFDIGKKSYYVKRGIKPDVFEIHCDGKLIDQTADAREYQRMLEDQILQMNFRAFSQVVVLSVSNFKPFMQLEAKDRREVIEDILDIRVFSAMNTVVKQKLSAMKEMVSAVDSNIDVQRQKADVQKRYIETLKTNLSERSTQLENDIRIANDNIKNTEDTIDSLMKEVDDKTALTSDAASILSKRSKLDGLLLPLKGRIKKLNENINFYHETEECPTCKQEISDTIRTDRITDTESKISEVEKAISKISVDISAIDEKQQEIDKIQAEINKIQREIQELNATIRADTTLVRRLSAELKTLNENTGNIQEEQENLKVIIDASMELLKRKSELSDSKQYLDISASLLKDSGIKTKIVEQYLPVMNKLINNYLNVLDLWISFHLDGEFNETLKSRHRDNFTYHSFSEGEKQRIDLAILFTWRTIAKMKNSVSCSLLIFDEVLDRALDFAGTEHVARLLDTLGDGTNVFIISHKIAELQDKFHSSIEFEKAGNFTQIKTA